MRVLLGDHTFDGVVSDRGEGFGERDVGVSAEAFGELVGSLEVGRVAGVEVRSPFPFLPPLLC